MLLIGSTATTLLGLTGCGGGGGSSSGGGSISVDQSAAISDLVVNPSGSSTTLQFTVTDPNQKAQLIEVEFSENRGGSYGPATLQGQPTNSFSIPPGGGTFVVEWSHGVDIGGDPQGDLVLRVTPIEASSGAIGDRGHTPVFGVGGNTSPVTDAVSTPTGIQGGSIPFTCFIRDGQSDAVGILLEYSLDGGIQWLPGTLAAESATTFPTSPEGTECEVLWDAESDAPNTSSAVTRVRITPVDLVAGSPGVSDAFQVHLYRPAIDSITLGAIPGSMNGSLPYTNSNGVPATFHLRVPTVGAEFTIETSAATGGAAVDPSSLLVRCDQDLPGLPAGTDLASLFEAGGGALRWTVAEEQALPVGMLTLTARIWDDYGNSSPPKEFTVEAHPGSASNHPFDWEDSWYLDFHADHFTIAASGSTNIEVGSALGANGIPDFIEDLRIVGLQSVSPLPAAEAIGSNALLHELVTEEIVGRLRELFGGDFDGGTPGFAPNLTFSLDPAGTTSSIRVGGDDVNPGFALGRAAFDHRNATANQNATEALGVFTTNLIEFYGNSFYFRQRFGALMPGIGTPAGEHALDPIVLAPSFDRLAYGNTAAQNDRYDDLWVAIEAWGRGVSVILAHEIGHSIGLCTNGAPPSGLFGGASSAEFAGTYTTPYHIDTPGNNLMAAALSFTSALVVGYGGYRFNELNEAYLRQWHLLGN